MAIKYSASIIANRLTSLNTDIGAGAKLRAYTGTRPTNVGTALSGNTLLVELVCNATTFGAVSAGVLTAGTITNGTAVATGTATFYRLFKADGTTACIDGDISTTGADLNLSSTAINSGQTVSVSSLTYTGQPV